MLKRQGENFVANTDLPSIIDDGAVIMISEAILDTHWVKKGSRFIKESLV